MEVAAGFFTHSGWAVAVVAGLLNGHLWVSDRRQVELISPELPRQAYHAAVELPPTEAQDLVAAVDASIVRWSFAALATLREGVEEGVSLVAVGIVGQAAREIPDTATVLANHALMHASEGEQYRRGVGRAADQMGLPVRRTVPGRLDEEVTQLTGWSARRLADEHAQVKAAIGAPWRKEHRQAAAAALVAAVRQ